MLVNITEKNVKDCLEALGKEYFEYSVYGDSCLSKGDRVDCLLRYSDFQLVDGEELDDIDLYHINIDELNVAYEALGISCINDVGFSRGEDTIVNEVAIGLANIVRFFYKRNIQGGISMQIEIDETLDYSLGDNEDFWERKFVEPISDKFIKRQKSYGR